MNADESSDSDRPSSADALPPEEVERAVEELGDRFLDGLRRGQREDIAGLVQQHPQLAPHLEERLKLYQAIFRATKQSPATEVDNLEGVTVDYTASDPGGELYANSAYRIGCPHCGNQVQVVNHRLREVICDSCGSSVQVRPGSSRRSKSSELPPMPDQLGHFRVLRMLGEGGFGIVYLAEDLTLDRRPVAIKVPRHGFFATRDEEQRFFREAKHVARLRHANIAQVLEISEDRNTPFIVSEFIDGLTLRDLARDGCLSHRDSATLMIQIAEAIDYAHHHKIIHRDLKTSNILVDAQRKAYVVDFGLSRRDDAEITMTVDGAIIGTVQYMSPEQALGNQAEVGPWSDIYSLGVILYELLCRELPFHGSKRMVIEQVIYEEPRSPQRLNENVPKDLATIALKAMAKKPQQRYASAQDFADDLARWLRGDPIRARPISLAVYCWSWCRRHPSTAISSAVIAALLLLSTAVSLGWAFEQTRLKKLESQARAQSDERQYTLLTQNGVNRLADNDLTTAAWWFSEALALNDNPVNRQRIGMIQDRIPKLTRLWSTGVPVDTIAFNRDGDRVGAASFQGRIACFDVSTGETITTQQVRPFSQFKLSPAGDKFALCGNENDAQLWDADRGRLIKTLAHTDFVVSIDFALSGDLIATGSFDSFARVWETADGGINAERKFEGLQVVQVAFVPESNLIAVATHNPDELGDELHVWDYVADELVAGGLKHAGHITNIEFADQGASLCSASRDGQVKVWNARTGEQIGKTLQLRSSPRSVIFGESSKQVVSIAYDFNVQVWDLETGTQHGPQIHRSTSYASAAQSSSNRLLALGGGDGTVQIVRQATGEPATSLLKNSESASAIAFHPDGRRLAVGGTSGMLQFWDLAGGAPLSFQFRHAGAVRNALFSPDGSRCLTAGVDGTAYIWNAENGKQLAQLEQPGRVAECAVSFDGKVFATASFDQGVMLWDGFTGAQIGDALKLDSPVYVVAFSPIDQRLVAGCSDGTIVGWNMESSATREAPAFVQKHEDRVLALAYSPDGRLFASCSLDGTARGWNAVTGQPEFGPFKSSLSINSCSFMPDNKRLLTCGLNGADIWDIASGRIDYHLPCEGEVYSAFPFSGGTRVMTNELRGRTRLWEIRNGAVQLEYALSHPNLESVYYSDTTRDGTLLAFAGGSFAQGDDKPQSGSTILWDLTQRLPLAPRLPHLGTVRRVSFDASGKKLLTASVDETARLWKITASELPIADARLLASLYAETARDLHGRSQAMQPDELMRDFKVLSLKYPNYFNCDAEEIEAWNEEVRRMRELTSKSDELHTASGF